MLSFPLRDMALILSIMLQADRGPATGDSSRGRYQDRRNAQHAGGGVRPISCCDARLRQRLAFNGGG